MNNPSELPRKTPNFLLVYGGDHNKRVEGVPFALTGGIARRPGEDLWEVVGLYHDEDEAFEAMGAFRATRERGAGQLVLTQIYDCAYGSYDADGHPIIGVVSEGDPNAS